jgi:TRAP-type C4-dicarboxylate transport system permease small subunit
VTTPVRPADRYGDRPTSRRRRIALSILAVIIVATAIAVMIRIADSGVRSSLISWQNPVDDVMMTTIEVTRTPGTEVTCQLAARDIRQIIVGQTTVDIPADSARATQVEVAIPLQGDAVAPEIQHCQATD